MLIYKLMIPERFLKNQKIYYWYNQNYYYIILVYYYWCVALVVVAFIGCFSCYDIHMVVFKHHVIFFLFLFYEVIRGCLSYHYLIVLPPLSSIYLPNFTTVVVVVSLIVTTKKYRQFVGGRACSCC